MKFFFAVVPSLLAVFTARVAAGNICGNCEVAGPKVIVFNCWYPPAMNCTAQCSQKQADNKDMVCCDAPDCPPVS
ncbi:hypothetical protein ACJQWK_11643 [Exserohilum turcicum]|uniref:Uncharacterized protein n=1 Tax=Exserohilum turcicum (strain 28A) TaxID=671987 RepID=R0J2V4_EXST2|nr:uncharacterized protein SETTUDRAFT_25170 [Exserohilum turcica Et28A]EOA91076.1 hypothetical protein SETTUDRAFT_25170 [Exserohilum turcica Et28A]